MDDKSTDALMFALQLGLQYSVYVFLTKSSYFRETFPALNHPKILYQPTQSNIPPLNQPQFPFFPSSLPSLQDLSGLIIFIITSMQQKQVLQLIETVVKPLREKIEHLERENEKLKTQLNLHQRAPYEAVRRRSISKDQRGTPKKGDAKEVLSPASKKKEEKGEKPVWGYGKPAKPESNQMKSPPPKDKNLQTPNSKVRALSKDKPSDKKPQSNLTQKRIVGGKKADPQPSKHQSPQTQPSPKQQQSSL